MLDIFFIYIKIFCSHPYTLELALWVGTMALSPPLGVTSEADDVLAMAADELSVQVTPAVLGNMVPWILVYLSSRASSEGSQRFHNHGEGP